MFVHFVELSSTSGSLTEFISSLADSGLRAVLKREKPHAAAQGFVSSKDYLSVVKMVQILLSSSAIVSPEDLIVGSSFLISFFAASMFLTSKITDIVTPSGRMATRSWENSTSPFLKIISRNIIHPLLSELYGFIAVRFTTFYIISYYQNLVNLEPE